MAAADFVFFGGRRFKKEIKKHKCGFLKKIAADNFEIGGREFPI